MTRAARPASISPAQAEGRSRLLAELREQVRRIEGIGGSDGRAVVPLGVAALDDALPGGGLPLGAVHEVIAPEGVLDSGSATAFTAMLAAKLSQGRGPVFWIVREPDLYVPGLVPYGLHPDQLTLILIEGHTRRAEADTLWCLEELLRTRPVGAVVAEVGGLDLATSRRLQLAAETGGVPGLLLRLRPQRVEASAAVTRWSVQARPATLPPDVEPDLWPEIRNPSWRVELLRARGGRPGVWPLVWQDGVLEHEEGAPLAAEAEEEMPLPEAWPAPGAAAAG